MTKADTLKTLASLVLMSRCTDAGVHSIAHVADELRRGITPLYDTELEDLEAATAQFQHWPSSQVRRAQFVATCEALYTALYERA